jgi:hypothetical protein
MKNRIAFLFAAVGVLVLVGTYAVNDFVQANNDCRKPSANTKFCISAPSNQVSSCAAQPGGNCVGKSTYSRNQFPDGTTSASSGTTMEEEADCYQETKCRQNANDVTKCESAPTLPYAPGDKIVAAEQPCE